MFRVVILFDQWLCFVVLAMVVFEAAWYEVAVLWCLPHRLEICQSRFRILLVFFRDGIFKVWLESCLD